jgi:hypothetical protein
MQFDGGTMACAKGRAGVWREAESWDTGRLDLSGCAAGVHHGEVFVCIIISRSPFKILSTSARRFACLGYNSLNCSPSERAKGNDYIPANHADNTS